MEFKTYDKHSVPVKKNRDINLNFSQDEYQNSFFYSACF